MYKLLQKWKDHTDHKDQKVTAVFPDHLAHPVTEEIEDHQAEREHLDCLELQATMDYQVKCTRDINADNTMN